MFMPERPRPVEREQRRDVLEPGRPQPTHECLHAGGVELEHAERVPGAEHRERPLVVHLAQQDRVVHVERDAPVVADVPLRVREHGEVAQPQEVHLQQTERLRGAHLVLREDLAALGPHQRDDLRERARTDDDGGRVDAVVTLQPLESRRDLEDLAVLGLLTGGTELGRLDERLRERRLDPLDGGRHHLREVVADLERLVEDTRGVTDAGLGLDRPERHDLRDVVGAVPLGRVADHLAAATVVEVDVDVRHLDARRVEEAFEDESVADRVDPRDVGAVRDDGTTGRTATGPDADADRTGVPAEVGDDQEVGREPHLLDDAELVLDPLRDGGREWTAVALPSTLEDHRAQVLRLRAALGDGELRAAGRGRTRCGPAALRDLERRVQRVTMVGERRPHLRGGLHEELVGLEPEATRVGQLRPGLDAQQRVMRRDVVGARVVRVVGDDRAQAELTRQPLEHRPHAALLGDAVVLQLDEVAVGTEQVTEVPHDPSCCVLVATQEMLVDLRPEAAGEHDESLVMLGEQLHVDARLVPVALEVGPAGERHQVAVAGVVLGEHGQVVRPLLAVGAAALLVAARSDRLIQLRAEDRVQAPLRGRTVELDETEQHPMVGDRDAGLPIPLDRVQQVVDTRSAVEHRVLGVDVQVHESARSGRPASLSRTGGHDATDLRTDWPANLAAAPDATPEADGAVA
jgi:hypothetical protein